MLDVAHVDQKCLSVRGSEIELKAICQLENFLAIVQGHSKSEQLDRIRYKR